jgi:hypothetical protein
MHQTVHLSSAETRPLAGHHMLQSPALPQAMAEQSMPVPIHQFARNNICPSIP